MTTFIAALTLNLAPVALIPAEVSRIHPDAATSRIEEQGPEEGSILTTLLLPQE